MMNAACARGGRAWVLLGALLVWVALSGQSHAQSADAALRGKAPADSVVTAKNTATGLTRKAQVSNDGRYALVGLPPGTYLVDAGAGTQKTVTLSVATTATLDLQAEPATAENLEAVVVTATALREVRTSEIATGISRHQIETTPQITRNFLEFADAVPGMQFQVDSKGNTSIQSGAQGMGATNVYIDGVGQKNYIRDSGPSGQGGADNRNNHAVGDPGNPFPQLAIAEYKVITSNYKAEYDQLSGAAITAVTKSGTNTFEAEAFGNYTNGSWRAQTPAELFANKGKVGGPSKEFGFAVGGPIIQDRIHYFLTYEGKQFTTPNVVRAPSLIDRNGVAQDWAGGLTPELRSNYSPVSNPFKENLIFGKLDWEVSDMDRLELSGKFRRERQQTGAAGVIAASAASYYINDDHRFQLRWERTSGDRFNEATFTYEKTNDTPTSPTNENSIQYIAANTINNGFDPILTINGVRPRDYFRSAQRGFGLQDDLTLSNVEWHGEHTFKTGIKFKDVKLEDRDASTNAQYSYYVNPAPGGIDPNPFQVEFGALSANKLPVTTTSKNRQFGVYFQDDWAVNEHVLLNLGLRYDYEQTPTYTGFVTPQAYVDALNGPDTNGCPTPIDQATCPYFFNGAYRGANLAAGQTYAQTLAKAGVNISDYISNGHNRKNPSNEFQPRIGISFDLRGDQKHVVFVGAGRSYDRNVFSILQHETNKATLYVPTIQFKNANNPGCDLNAADRPNCIDWNDAYLTQAGLQSIAPTPFGEMHLMNNNLKAPYSDQISIGMRNRVGNWNTSVTVARVRSRNGIIASQANYFGDGSWYWYDTGNWSGYTGLVPNAGSGALYLFDNAKESKNTQVLVSLDKPYTSGSGWGASIAYTFANGRNRLDGTGNGDYQLDYARPQFVPFTYTDRQPKHRLVMIGNVDVPWGVNVGAKLVLETPRPIIGFPFDDSQPANGFNSNYPRIAEWVRDSVGYRSVDFQVTKTFKFAGGTALQTRIDVLNAFNWKNYADYFDFFSYATPPAYDKNGNIRGVPRTIKAGMNIRF
jgi:outer membrane receptor protein involved in Fe transport